MTEPSLNGPSSGRDSAGRFAVGNPGGAGNPFGQKSNAIRAAIIDDVDSQ